MTKNHFFIAMGVLGIVVGIWWAGYTKGGDNEEIDQLKDSVDAVKDRNDVDIKIQKRSPYAICVNLGGLPDKCDELRRVDPAPADK